MTDSLAALPTSYLIAMSAWLVGGVLGLRWLLKARRRWKDRPRRLRAAHVLLSLWMLLATLTALALFRWQISTTLAAVASSPAAMPSTSMISNAATSVGKPPAKIDSSIAVIVA